GTPQPAQVHLTVAVTFRVDVTLVVMAWPCPVIVTANSSVPVNPSRGLYLILPAPSSVRVPCFGRSDTPLLTTVPEVVKNILQVSPELSSMGPALFSPIGRMFPTITQSRTCAWAS